MLLGLAAVWLYACGGASDPAVPSPADGAGAAPITTGIPVQSEAPAVAPADPADPAAVAAVRTRIDATRLDDPTTLDEVGAVRFDDGAPEAAAQALAGGARDGARWAAAWIYASSGTDPEVLRPLLADPDSSVAAMAAAAMTAWGDREGIPVLVRLATDEARLTGSYPPVTVADFALGSLDRFVDGPPRPVGASPGEDAAAWEAWLAASDPATLRFDPESGTWSAR